MKRDIDEAFGIQKIILFENQLKDLQRQRQNIENEVQAQEDMQSKQQIAVIEEEQKTQKSRKQLSKLQEELRSLKTQKREAQESLRQEQALLLKDEKELHSLGL